MSKLPPNVNITRIVNYLRRSREDLEREKRTGEDTITMQKELMHRLLEEYALPYDQVMEIGSGDKIASRPIFQQVLADLRSEKYNCIAVKEISRLTRGDFADYGMVYELFRTKRIFILTPYRLYDPKNANDMRQIRFEMFLSREEFETVRERMQSAKYSYAMSGKFMGSKPAYGYRCNAQTQRLEINEDEAQHVKLIFQLFLHGMGGKELGLRAISTYLTRANIPSPTGLFHWNAPSVKKILTNRVYIGEIRYSTTYEMNQKRQVKPRNEWIVVEEAHSPIISREMFYLVEQKFSRNKTPSTRFDYQPAELSGLVCCAKCGHKMVRQLSKSSYRKKDGNQSFYEKEMLCCTTVGCSYVKYRAVEAALLQFLERIAPAPKLLAPLLAAKELLPATTFYDQKTVLLKQQDELTERLKAVYRNYEAGIYSDKEFIQRRVVTTQELEQVQQLLQQVEECDIHYLPIEQKKLESMFTSYASVYKHLPTSTIRNRLLRTLIESVQLELLQRGRGNKLSRFRIDIYFRFAPASILRPPSN